MSVERTIVCDKCSSIIAAENTVEKAREQACGLGAKRINGKDYCAFCLQRILDPQKN